MTRALILQKNSHNYTKVDEIRPLKTEYSKCLFLIEEELYKTKLGDNEENVSELKSPQISK